MGRNEGTVEFQLSGRKLANKDTFGKSDPFLVISALESDNRTYKSVHQTEVIDSSLDPAWDTFQVDADILCRGDFSRSIKFECFDYDGPKSRELIGEFTTTLDEMADKREYDLIEPKKASKKKYVNSGVLVVNSWKFKPKADDPPPRRPQSASAKGRGTASGSRQRPSSAHASSPSRAGNVGRASSGDGVAGGRVPSDARVTLQFAGRDLPKMDTFGTADPFFIISQIQDDGSFVKVYESEVVKNSLNPVWDKFSLSVEELCDGDDKLSLKIELYDQDAGSSNDFMGACTTNLSDLVSGDAKQQELLDPKKIGKKKYTNSGIFVALSVKVESKNEEAARQSRFDTDNPDDLAVSRSTKKDASRPASKPKGPDPTKGAIHFRFKASGLPKMDTFGKSDPFLVISRIEDSTGEWVKVYQTETIEKTLDPMWDEFSVSVQELCEGDYNRKIELACYDYDKGSSNDLIGKALTSLGELMSSRTEYPLVDPKKSGKKNYTNSGVLTTLSATHVAEDATRKSRGKLKGPQLQLESDSPATQARCIDMVVECRDLPKMDTFGKSDPFLTFSRLNEDGSYFEAHRTEVVKKSLNPTFLPIVIRVDDLIDGDPNSAIKVECYDEDFGSGNDLMGSFSTTLKALLNDREFKFLRPKGKSGGVMQVQKAELRDYPKSRFAEQDKKIAKKNKGKAGKTEAEKEAERKLQEDVALEAQHLKKKHSKNKNKVVTMKLGCKGLEKMDTFGKSDPLVILSAINSDGSFTKLHETEPIKNTLDPSFPVFTVPVEKMVGSDGNYERQIMIEVYDDDAMSKDFMARCTTTLPELMVRRTYDLLNPKKANKKNYKNSGTMDILKISIDDGPPETDASKVEVQKRSGGYHEEQKKLHKKQYGGKTLVLKASGTGLDKMDTFGKADPFLRISRLTASGKHEKVIQTEEHSNTLDPVWKAITVATDELCGDDFGASLLFECFDSDVTGNDLIGKFEASLPDIMSTNKFDLINPKKVGKRKYVNSGVINILSAELKTAAELRQGPKIPEADIQRAKDEVKNQARRSCTLVMSAKNLEKMDTFGKSDPYVVISHLNEAGGYTEIHKTEVIDGVVDCTWEEITLGLKKLIDGDYQRSLLFEVYDDDIGASDLIGKFQTSLPELLGTKEFELINPKKVGKKKYENSGTLIFDKIELAETTNDGAAEAIAALAKARKISRDGLRNNVVIDLSGRDIEKMDVFGKSDPFVTISTLDDNAEWKEVARTEVQKKTLNPDWARLVIPVKDLCIDTYSRPLVLECWDFDKGSRNDRIGKYQLTIIELFKQKKLPIVDPDKKGKKNYENSGTIHVNKAQLQDPHGQTVDHEEEFGPDWGDKKAKVGRGRTVVMQFRAHGLADLDGWGGGKSDPKMHISRMDRDGTFTRVHTTEVCENTLDPEWETFTMTLEDLCEEDFSRTLRFDVVDDDPGGDDLIGSFTCTLPHLASRREYEVIHPKKAKKKRGYTNSGTVEVVRLDIQEEKKLVGKIEADGDLELQRAKPGKGGRSVVMRFAAKRLDLIDGDAPDTFLMISHLNRKGSYTQVFQTEVKRNSSNPTWKPFSVALDQLCGGDLKRALLFETYHWDRLSGENTLVGHFTTTLPELLSRLWYALVDPKKRKKKSYTNSGVVEVLQCELREQNGALSGGTIDDFLEDADMFDDEIDEMYKQYKNGKSPKKKKARPSSAPVKRPGSAKKRPASAASYRSARDAYFPGERSSPSKSPGRKRPSSAGPSRKTFDDRESLREQVMKLKKENAELKQEKRMLNTRALRQEGELTRKDRQIQELLASKSGSQFKTLRTETTLIGTLRREVKVMRATLAERDREIRELRAILRG